MSNIYDALVNLFHKPISEIAKGYNYSQSNIYILNGEFGALQEQYPDVWRAIETCVHQRDKRTPEEYAQDLVSSWVYEDVILGHLRKNFNIHLSGSDQNRNILSNNKIRSDSDFSIEKHGKNFAIELINSYTNYWKRTLKIDLRDDKFQKLQKKSALLACIDIYNKEFYLIDLKNMTHDIQYISHHEPWSKPAYQISIKDTTPIGFTIENLIQTLNLHVN